MLRPESIKAFPDQDFRIRQSPHLMGFIRDNKLEQIILGGIRT